MHVVQELAGHSDIRTTRQFYVKIPPEQMARARRVIDSLVGPDLVTE
jgi:site-specific recombinase XerD